MVSLFAFSLPEAASSIAHKVDGLYNFIYGLSLIGFVLLMGVIAYFLIKFRRKTPHDKTAYLPGNTTLEVIWTAIPTIIFVAIAIWGWVVFQEMEKIPNADEKISLTARKWSWEFTYQNNESHFKSPDLIVPVGKSIVLEMVSEDVIHSFYVPSFRVKKDIVPGLTTRTWFSASKEGEYRLYCAEYCGTSHSRMTGMVKVVSLEEYDKWKQGQFNSQNAPAPLHELGRKVYELKGCNACHGLDEKPMLGPSFAALWGAKREFSEGPALDQANEEYIRESILDPKAKIVKGYPPVMNSYQGALSEEEIKQLIAFLKFLKEGKTSGAQPEKENQGPTAVPSAGNAEKGKQLLTSNACLACHTDNGSPLVGPSFKGLWGTERELVDGTKAQVDFDYLKESILNPTAKVAKGFEGRVMMSYEGKLSEEEIRHIAAYLEQLK